MILPCPFPFSLYDGSIYFHTTFFAASGRNAFAIPASRPVCIGSPVPNSPQKSHFRGMLCARTAARALKIFSASPLWTANRSCFHSGGCFFFSPFPSSADSLCFSALFSFVFSSGAFSGSVSSAKSFLPSGQRQAAPHLQKGVPLFFRPHPRFFLVSFPAVPSFSYKARK